MELFGRARLPMVSDKPYSLTLGSYAFYWMALERPLENEAQARLGSYAPPLARGLVAARSHDRRRARGAGGGLAGLSRVALLVRRGGRRIATARVNDGASIGVGDGAPRHDVRHGRVRDRRTRDVRLAAGVRATERHADSVRRGRLRLRQAGRRRRDARRRARRRDLGPAAARRALPRSARRGEAGRRDRHRLRDGARGRRRRRPGHRREALQRRHPVWRSVSPEGVPAPRVRAQPRARCRPATGEGRAGARSSVRGRDRVSQGAVGAEHAGRAAALRYETRVRPGSRRAPSSVASTSGSSRRTTSRCCRPSLRGPSCRTSRRSCRPRWPRP